MFGDAFDVYMNDPRRPTLVQVARDLRISPVLLTRHAQEKGWEGLRANSVSVQAVSQNERRINIAKQVDERIVLAADEAVTRASKVYLEVIEKIAEMPLDPMMVPDDELTKDDHGNVKNRPKRSKLIEDKTFLLNQAMDGFMKMSAGAQGIGLVLSQKGNGITGAAEDLSKLSKLNVLLLNIQQGKGDDSLKRVEELKPMNANE